MDLVSVVTSEVKRPTAEFRPTIWGDIFLSHAPLAKSVDASVQQKLERLKAEVRAILMDVSHNPSKKFRLIDAIQRLGIAYHFEAEIEDALLEQMSYPDNIDDDLDTVALRFRLLRQQGIKVSCDVFGKFKDGERNFKDSLIDDVPGMLSFYEAAHLGMRGEQILDEALAFTTTKLEPAVAQLSPQIAEEVRHTLKWPINKTTRRLEAKYFMTRYSRDDSHSATLLKFAELDFSIVQELHQKELHAITEWWKNLKVKEKLPYARDRIVECYFWMLQVYFEPKYSVGRIILTKIISILSLFDDTYDNYGTIMELQRFTEVIQRWDHIKAIDGLPECMKIIYRTLIDVISEIERLMEKEGRSYCLHYAKQAMKVSAQAYFDEAKWRDDGYVPTLEEYINVSQISAGLLALATASFFGMGPIATKGAFEWLFSKPKVVRALSIIGRLEDDIVSHKFEQNRDHVASAVECYMNQHHVSEEEAVKMLREEIANAWKDMNEECLKPTAVAMPLLERIFNLARAMDVVYKDGDGYTENHLIKEHIASLFLDPVPV